MQESNQELLQRQQGFTLLEAMMALMVLSIGLLATATMQDVALSRNVDANQLTLATNMATEMIERIRFNNSNVAAYGGIDTQNNATRPPSSQSMARGDYDQWQSRLAAAGLTNMRGRVTVSSIGPTNLNQSQVTVQVTWSGTSILSHSLSLVTIIAPE